MTPKEINYILIRKCQNCGHEMREENITYLYIPDYDVFSLEYFLSKISNRNPYPLQHVCSKNTVGLAVFVGAEVKE